MLFATLMAALYTAAVVLKVLHGAYDFPVHAGIAERALSGEGLPPHFL